MNRLDKILFRIDRSMRILEIGPSYNPAVPKAGGWTSFILDHATQAELQEKYAYLGPSISNIEPVDFLWHSGPIESAIPEDMHGTFDACITSHVIEHLPNPIQMFHSLDRLLTDRGVVSFAVPDKRYCFDFFRPITLAPAWIEAFERKATRHSQRAVLEFCAYSCHNGDQYAWGQDTPIPMQPRLSSELAPAKGAADAASMSDDSAYVDCHSWTFTPASYELLFLELGALGLLNFTVERVFPTVGCEFMVTMRKGKFNFSPQAVQSRRLELLRAMFNEQAEQIHSMNGWSLAQLVNEVTALRSERNKFAHEAAKLVDEATRSAEQIARLTEERDSLINSASWKVTSPLRALKTKIVS